MHAESSTTHSTAITEPAFDRNSTTSQHGIPAYEPPVSLPPADNAGAGQMDSAAEQQLALDAALATSLQESGGRSYRNRGMSPSPPSTPSPPVFNRIAEYEKASTPPVRRRDGPAFEIIKKVRSPGDKRSPIQELPNGS